MKGRAFFQPLICVAAGGLLIAQSPDSYRQAYAAWQTASANLETDAAKAGELLAVKTDAASPAAVKFEEARKAFFDAQSAPLKDAAQRWEPIQLPDESSAAKADDGVVANEDAALAKNIAALAGDPDQGIRQLRQAMEKERAALLAIREAAAAGKTSMSAVQTAADAAEHARMAAAEDLAALAANFQQSAEAEAKLVDAWPAYYRSLAEGARGNLGSAGAAVSTVAPPNAAGASTGASSSSAIPATANPVIVDPAHRAPAAGGGVQPPVPLARYTGSWGYAQGISNYYGELPTMFDVIVKVDGGQMQGIVSATFVVGRNRDPAVRFTFNGPLQATPNQVFSLKMNDGTTGTVELIPGPAFNLLEVKFNLDGAPKKVGTSDVTLLKK